MWGMALSIVQSIRSHGDDRSRQDLSESPLSFTTYFLICHPFRVSSFQGLLHLFKVVNNNDDLKLEDSI